jgi:hypothetical protein
MIAAGDEAGGTGGGRAGAWRVRAGGREDARADTREEAGGGGDALGRSGCAMEMAHYFGFNLKLLKSDYLKLNIRFSQPYQIWSSTHVPCLLVKLAY